MTLSPIVTRETGRNLLFDHFATLATAPDGIARLRELILQLAVQGKLGTQDAGDEPANVLLEKIKKAKEKLLKAGKVKKEKIRLNPDDEDSLTTLPINWRWSRLSEVGLVNPRNFGIDDNEEVSFIPMNLIPIGYKNHVQQEIRKWGEIRAGFTHFADNDVVMAKITPCFQNGKSVVLRNLKNGVGAGTTELHVFRPVDDLINPEYVILFLKSPEFLNIGVTRMTGSAGQKRVPNDYFSETPFPLPPLAEQHRIVAKVDRLMALCDELEARQQQERAGCLRLGTASLAGLQNAESPEEFERQWAQVCDAFDLILNYPENVAVLRQTILQMAVQGRLVRQEPGDEPAGKLLERIRKEHQDKERNQKTKKSSPTLQEIEFPFSIPKTWNLCSMEEITVQITDGEHNIPPRLTQGYPLVTAKNVRDGYLDFDRLDYVDPDIAKKCWQRCKPIDNDVLMVCVGATTGRVCYVESIPEVVLARSVALFRSNQEILFPQYLAYVLKSPFFQKDIWRNVKQLAQPGLYLGRIKKMKVPLPPLAEQHRIVAKVDALMALCDALESRLKERAGVQGRLTNAIVKEIGVGNA